MEDSQIIQLYWERDEQAIDATLQKYGSFCTAIAKNILGNDQDAEECVNDAYLSVWNAIPPHRPGILPAFLAKITRNTALNKYKHNTAQKRGGGQLPLVLDELSDRVSGKETVEQAFDRQELLQAIQDFLASLSPQKRNIFLCRYWYTDSVAAIAARCGMKEGAVAMTLSRLRRKLHRYLSERGFAL